MLNTMETRGDRTTGQKLRTVKALAKLSGVSVRTLHHYDAIGLLTPQQRSDAGYRLYGRAELLRLQQILFYREMGLSLDEIGNILDAPDFDLVTALEKHRRELLKRSETIQNLVNTIDRTLKLLSMEDEMITDEELYEGFSKEEVDAINAEVRELYDSELVAESERRIRSMSRSDWQTVKETMNEIPRHLATLMERSPEDPEVQTWIAKHHAWIETFYPCDAEVYCGLADLYTGDDRFRAFYDRFAPGLADFMKRAMVVFTRTL